VRVVCRLCGARVMFSWGARSYQYNRSSMLGCRERGERLKAVELLARKKRKRKAAAPFVAQGERKAAATSASLAGTLCCLINRTRAGVPVLLGAA
jgi:hypothetical protein